MISVEKVTRNLYAPKFIAIDSCSPCFRYAPVRYDCKQSPIILLETSTVMVQWSSDVNQQFTLSYVIGEYLTKSSTAACFYESTILKKKRKGKDKQN